MKHLKTYNESLRDEMKPKSDDEINFIKAQIKEKERKTRKSLSGVFNYFNDRYDQDRGVKNVYMDEIEKVTNEFGVDEESVIKIVNRFKDLVIKESLRDKMKPVSNDDIRTKLSELSISEWIEQVKKLNLDDSFMPTDEEIRNYLSTLPLLKWFEEIRKRELNYETFRPTKKEIVNKLLGLNNTNKIIFIIQYKLSYDLLPDDLIVRGDLYCNECEIKELPDNLTVMGNLICDINPLKKLPDNLTVGGFLSCQETQLKKLPNNLIVRGDLGCAYNYITELPDDLTVGGNIYCNNNKLTKLPDNLTVNGDLDCSYNKLTKLPNNLRVRGELNCSHNKLTKLPDDLDTWSYIYNDNLFPKR